MVDGRILRIKKGVTAADLIGDIRQSLSSRIVLDARGSDLLKNEVDLRLIIHFARDAKKQLTIVSHDASVHSLAAKIGIDVLSDIDSSDEAAAPVGPGGEGVDTDEGVGEEAPVGAPDGADESVDGEQIGSPQPGVGPARATAWRRRISLAPAWRSALVVAVGVAVVVSAGMLVYLNNHRVEIVVVPNVVKVSDTVVLKAYSTAKSVDVDEGLVPGTVLSSEVRYAKEIPTTGERREGISRAVGEVLFINANTTPVTVPARTVVRTANGIRFETINDVVVDKKTTATRAGIRIGESSGTALAAVRALEPGSSGNIASRSVRYIDGPAGSKLQVVNENEFRGGEDRVIRTVAQADVDRLKALAEAQMVSDGEIAIRKSAGMDRYLLRLAAPLQMRSCTIFPNVNEDAERVSIDCQGITSMLSVRLEDLGQAIRGWLPKKAGEGFALVTDSVHIGKISSSPIDERSAVVSVEVSAEFKAVVDAWAVVKLAAGRFVGEFTSLMRESTEVSDVFVKGLADDSRFPRWTRLIKVTVKGQDSEPAKEEELDGAQNTGEV